MPVCPVRPTNATAKQRRGAEAVQGLPAAIPARIYEPKFTSDDFGQETGEVEDPNIVPSGHAAEALPGSKTATGTVVATPDAHGLSICLASALRNASETTALGGGAFQTTYSRGQTFTGAVCSYTRQLAYDDGIHEEGVGCQTMQFDWSLAKDAAPSLTVTEEAEFTSVWNLSSERHPNPATGDLRLRGNPEDWIDRDPQDTGNAAGDVTLKLIDRFTNAKGIDELVFLGSAGAVGAISGTWTVGAGLNTFAGSGGAADTELVPGSVLDVDGQLLEVLKVTDADTFTTVGNHTAGAAVATLTREYGSENAATLTTTSVRAGINPVELINRWNTISNSSGGKMGNADTDGSTVQTHLTTAAGIVGGTKVALPGGGTVAVSIGSDVVTGTTTAFLADTRIGDMVFTPLTPLGKRVLERTSDTSIRVNSNYTAAESGVTMDVRPIPTVALTGTYTTASSTTLVGVGGNLTSLVPGAWVRTAGGEERRLATIASDDSATVTFAFANAEVGVTVDTDYEWITERLQPDWIPVTHPSGPFTELLSEINLFLQTPEGTEEKLSIVGTADWSFVAGRAAEVGVGSVFPALIKDSGSSTGTMELVVAKLSPVLRKATNTQQRARIRIVMSTGREINTSGREFTWEHVVHIKASGKNVIVPDATTNQDRIGGSMFDFENDPEGFTDAYTLIVTGDEAAPFPTS